MTLYPPLNSHFSGDFLRDLRTFADSKSLKVDLVVFITLKGDLNMQILNGERKGERKGERLEKVSERVSRSIVQNHPNMAIEIAHHGRPKFRGLVLP